MNRKIGFIASILAGASVAIFLICLTVALFVAVPFFENLSYGVCMLLSWAWVGMACVYSCYAPKEKSAAAKMGVAFAVLYAVFITLVYYTQLTTVLYRSVDDAIVQAFSFTAAGSWLFSLDLLGYGLLAFSTFFVGLTLNPANKQDKALKVLLLLHGIFCVCMLVPMLPMPSTNQGNGGVIVLIGWCLFFLPIGVLSVLHFRKLKSVEETNQ